MDQCCQPFRRCRMIQQRSRDSFPGILSLVSILPFADRMEPVAFSAKLPFQQDSSAFREPEVQVVFSLQLRLDF